MPRRRGSTGDCGAAAVEFALVVPILFMLILGIVTAGVAFSNAIGLTNAVREGARFGATTQPAVAGDWVTWADDVIAHTGVLQSDDPNGDSTICVRLWKNTGATAATPTPFQTTCADPVPASLATPPVVDAGMCAVSVWATRPYSINAFLIRHTGLLKSQAVEAFERTC